MADPHDATAHVTAALPAHVENHDHDGTPTQKILAANSHESPSPNTHHNQSHSNTDHTDMEPCLYRLKSGLYYAVIGFGSNATPTLDEMRLTWFPVMKTATLDRIGIWVQAGIALSVIRLGIYRDDGNGYPGTLVLDAGTVDASSSGLKEITISQQLTPDLYWIGGVGQTIVTAMTCALSGSTPPIGQLPIVTTPSAGNSTGGVGFLQASVSGALPGTFTSTKTNCASATFRVYLRVA